MWIILLDRSSSMGQPFSAVDSDSRPGRKRRTRASTKWEAAKEALISEVASLQPDQRIVLFVFNSASALAFDGIASDLEAMKSALDALEPANGTDLAAALRGVQNHLNDCREPHVAVEVIFDGLSSIDEARDAARDLARIVALIEVILIDPTEEGLAVANAVVQRGKVTQVTSELGLASEVRNSANSQAIKNDRMKHALAKASEERATVVDQVPQKERLSVTVGYPGALEAGIWQDLITYLHLPDSGNEVEKRLRVRSRAAGQRLAESSYHIIALRGTWFTLIPRLEGVVFNPPQQEVAWLEDVQEVPFRFLLGVELEGKSVIGGIDVLANGVCVAVVPIAIRTGCDAWSDADNPWETSSGSMFEEVFASYSRKDDKIVKAFADVYKAMGVHLFVDKQDLLGGQEWNPAILRKIEQADAFQLFWSTSSRTKIDVENEWKHALTYRSQKGHRFLRPLYWEEPKPVAPPELNKLNFAFLNLNTFGNLVAPELLRLSSDSDPTGTEPIEQAPINTAARTELSSSLLKSRSNSIQAPIVPILTGESRHSVAVVRSDVSRAIVFLEDLTGLRYYPAPTLMVDEFVVRRSRRICQIVDEVPEALASKNGETEVEIWTNVVRALLLQFHVRAVPPLAEIQSLNADEYGDSLKPSRLLEMLRVYAEGSAIHWLWSYKHFPWEEKNSSCAGRNVLPVSACLSERFLSAIDAFLNLYSSTRANSGTHTLSFSFPYQADFDERILWESVSKHLEPFGMRAEKKHLAPANDRDHWKYEVTASRETLIYALRHIRQQLIQILPRYDDVDYTWPAIPDESALICMGFAVVSDKIINQLKEGIEYIARSSWQSMSQWVIESIHPHWKQFRDWVASLEQSDAALIATNDADYETSPVLKADCGFFDFLDSYFSMMDTVFRDGLRQHPKFLWKQDYAISDIAWSSIKEHFPEIDLFLESRDERWGNKVGGPFESFVDLFNNSSRRLLSALKCEPSRNKLPANLKRQAKEILESNVLGAFVSSAAFDANAELLLWAIKQGTMQHATLPETNRVLYCTKPFDSQIESPSTGRLRRILSQCTLVHEHFHALLETGVSGNARRVKGPENVLAWNHATVLNESLAAWMELHFARRHGHLLGGPEDLKEVRKAQWAYIQCGVYPSWPYRGAEKIEQLYVRDGIAAVRSLINRLRDDPEAAQTEFDAMTID